MSNRQRKIMERQAEKNRLLAAAKRSSSTNTNLPTTGENTSARTPFRESELQFLARHPVPDFSLALDFRRPVEELLRDHPKVKRVRLNGGKRLSQFSELFGVKETDVDGQEQKQEEYAYLHEDHPGMIYIPAAFTPVAQRTLIKGCLKEYSRHPNKSNLDTHYKVPTSGLWDLHENVYLNKQSLDDPTVFVPRKADVDNQANGYGSDDDDDDDDDDNEAEAQDSNGKKQENGARPKPSQQHQPATKKPKPSSATNPPQRRAMVPITDETPTVPDNTPKTDPEPSSQVPILPPSQLVRKMRWITLGYQYHWPSKTYHFDQNAPFPKELCILSKAVVAAVDNSGEDERDGGKFEYPYPAEDFVAEAGVINYYQLKDRLMGHVDRSELNKHAPLVSFSFGHSCIYLLGGPTREQVPTPILLQSGDILVMTGPCRSAFHGVPRIIENTLPEYLQKDPTDPEWDIYADYLAEARINLNIRQVYPPKTNTTDTSAE
ncbi:hypothetical protein BGZ97_000178 [Linnemannia gamsii]|uniref:Fe2OG dioxygenase domain-containing protein n=1 Tax=Linnemannia gamsii TaxID=64522 RepID=A0A9P6R1B6_9FUNG|nr:hypothetical protein BGZ97_000178 [Linnemannia gamsii]